MHAQNHQLTHERTKITMVTKNWTSKVGLSRFPNNAHEAFLLTNGEISQEKFQYSRKKCMLQFSQNFINLFSLKYPSSALTNVHTYCSFINMHIL
jgi:hypothetical protein